MAKAVQRPKARRDFIMHYVYLAENAGLAVAKRFREAVQATYLRRPCRDASHGRTRESKGRKVRVSPSLEGEWL